MSEPVTPRVKPLPDGLLSVLVGFSAPNVFNPWASGDAMDTAPESRASYGARLERLLRHLDTKPLLLLVGEAPGFRGCHFSGVPFTNEKLILAGKIPVFPSRIGSPPASFRSANLRLPSFGANCTSWALQIAL